MDCNVPKIQFVVSNNMKFIAKSIDSLSFKNQIFPRIMQVVSSTNSKTLKIDMLNNIKSLYTKLDQNLINDKLLGTLEKVRKTDTNNDVCMCICDIYLEIAKIVNLEGIANKILPNLISMLVTANITKSNFDKIMGLISTYLDQIKKNRYNELINDGSTLNVDSLANNKTNNTNDFNSTSTKEDDNFMDSLLASSKPITTTNTSTNNKGTEDFLNNLIGSNSSSFNNNKTNTSSNNNSSNNDFTFFGSNNNKTSNNNNNSKNNDNDFDFNIGNTSSSKKNDLFAGVSNNNNYNMPSKSNNDLFSNMNINNNTSNNDRNKGDLLNNLMKDLPSANNNNNNKSNNYGNNNNNNC